MRCDEVRAALPGYVKEQGQPLALRRHVSRCRGCKEELRRYEYLVEELASLESSVVDAPRDLLPKLVAIPRYGRLEQATGHFLRHRRTYVGAAGVAAASIAGATAWHLRRQRVAPARA